MLWQTKGPTCHYLIYNTGQKQALKRVREKQDKHIVISCIYSSSLNHSCIGNLQRGTLLLESSYNFLLLRVCHIPPHKLLLTMTPRSSFLAQLHIVCGTQHILWSDLNLAPTSFVCRPWLSEGWDSEQPVAVSPSLPLTALWIPASSLLHAEESQLT